MGNKAFSILYCFLIVCAIFNVRSNFIIAETTPMYTVTPFPTPTPQTDVITGDATDVTSSSATLHAIVPFGMTATGIYFEYDTTSGTYTNSVDAEREGVSDNMSAKIGGLSAGTIYYYRIVAVTKPVPPVTTGYTYGSEKSFTTLSATPTVTPMPECEIESIEVFPKRLTLKIGKGSKVTVTAKGKNNCSTEGKIVKAKINKVGSKRILVSPAGQASDENGEAEFTITARNKAGNAMVAFTADRLKESLIVRVRR